MLIPPYYAASGGEYTQKRLKKQTGDVKAKSGYHTGHRRIIRDIEGFKKFIELNFDKTTMELAVNSGRKMIQIFNMQRLKIDTVS
ncbi:hypothetical protein [Rickettsia endosymbiont of Gonocerus acuteangulatus]|uniref:hypothetical protein n=1 Tax=Rickettsia endosymbiont of Gonocerus acuteangulatus TaxID=3066266 RepID=UPI003132D7EE